MVGHFQRGKGSGRADFGHVSALQRAGLCLGCTNSFATVPMIPVQVSGNHDEERWPIPLPERVTHRCQVLPQSLTNLSKHLPTHGV